MLRLGTTVDFMFSSRYPPSGTSVPASVSELLPKSAPSCDRSACAYSTPSFLQLNFANSSSFACFCPYRTPSAPAARDSAASLYNSTVESSPPEYTTNAFPITLSIAKNSAAIRAQCKRKRRGLPRLPPDYFRFGLHREGLCANVKPNFCFIWERYFKSSAASGCSCSA